VKRAIVIIILLILVGGGGAGALIMTGMIPNPFSPKPILTAAEEAAAKVEASRKKFEAPNEVMTFVNLRDMIIPVVIGTNIERKVYMSVRLQVVKDQKDTVETAIVRYENAVIKNFIPYFQTYFAKNNLLDPIDIKKRLNEMARQLYGDKVIDVKLVNVFEQKFGTMD
jgi:hypothetical protein